MIVTKWLYIFKVADGSFKGIDAMNEEEAREIADLRNYEVRDLVRVEEMKTKGME